MNMFFRMIWLLLTKRSKEKLGFYDTCTSEFRVLPTDLDLNFHMNNGVFFSIFDLARFDLGFRVGFMSYIRRKKLMAVVASQSIRYRRSLKPLSRFSVESRYLGNDGKYFFFNHVVMQKEKVCAHAVVKLLWFNRHEKLDPNQAILEVTGEPCVLELPEWVREWSTAEEGGWNMIKNE